MRYNYEFKKKCVLLYRKGKWAETPEGITQKSFRSKIRLWAHCASIHGLKSLKPKKTPRKWTAGEKCELVKKVLDGGILTNVALEADITVSLLFKWVEKYRKEGYTGLIQKQIGRPAKDPSMKRESIQSEKREDTLFSTVRNFYIFYSTHPDKEIREQMITSETLRNVTNVASATEKTRVVKTLREQGYSLQILLKVADLPRGTYYDRLKRGNRVKERNQELAQKITSIFTKHRGSYGVRRITQELKRQGINVNHKRVQRIMNELGLFGKYVKASYHSFKRGFGTESANVINRNFMADRPLQKWTTDVTQFSFSWGKCYLSPILDMKTNEIISYDLSRSPNMKQVKNMLRRAFARFPKIKGLILHSDQGYQYRNKEYQEILQKHGIIQSMSKKGDCYDNSIMESFFGRLKVEMLYGNEAKYTSFESFSKAIRKYIHYYNHERIQSKTNYMPPSEYRELLMRNDSPEIPTKS